MYNRNEYFWSFLSKKSTADITTNELCYKENYHQPSTWELEKLSWKYQIHYLNGNKKQNFFFRSSTDSKNSLITKKVYRKNNTDIYLHQITGNGDH